MAQKLKMITCDPKCGFMIRSHNEREVMGMAMRHAKDAHPDMNMSEMDLKKMMKDA